MRRLLMRGKSFLMSVLVLCVEPTSCSGACGVLKMRATFLVVALITLSLQGLAQASESSEALRLLQEQLARQEHERLQVTTRWRIRIEVFARSEDTVRSAERSVQERLQRGELKREDAERLLQSIRESAKDRVSESIVKVEGQGDFWITSGKVCNLDVGGASLATKEVLLPGSYVIAASPISLEASQVQAAPELVEPLSVQSVRPEASGSHMPGSPLLSRIFLLGENPLRWLPLEFVSVRKEDGIYVIDSRHWYYKLTRVKEQWTASSGILNSSESKLPKSKLPESLSARLKVSFFIDPTKGFAVSRFEGIQGQEVVEVRRWRRFGTLLLPEQIVMQRFATDMKGGERVVQNGITYLVDAQVVRRPVSKITIDLLSVEKTTRRVALKDLLPPDRTVADYRLETVEQFHILAKQRANHR
jgi:hypothetical protein